MNKILLIALVVLLIGAAVPVKASAEINRDFDFSVDDIYLLAAAMQLENGMNSDLCVYLTGTVIINRVRSPYFPNTVKGVLFQKGQYADVTLRNLYTVKITERVLSLALRVAMHTPIDSDIIFQSMQPKLGKVRYIIDGEYFATE